MRTEVTTPEHQIIDDVLQYIQDAENGNISPLDAVVELREKRQLLEKALKAMKEFEGEYLAEIEQEAKANGNIYRGYKFEFVNGRKTYDFKGIPEWKDLELKKKEVESKYKTMLEAKLNGSKFANVTEDGEELPLPQLKFGASFMKLKQVG